MKALKNDSLKLSITEALAELRAAGPDLRQEARVYIERVRLLGLEKRWTRRGWPPIDPTELCGLTEISLIPGRRVGDHIYLTRKACGLIP